MRRWKIQRLSGGVLGVLLLMTLVVVALFFLGGEAPEEQRVVADVSLSEPAQTDVLMGWMYVLLGLAVGVSLVGVMYKFVARCLVSPRSALRSLLGVALVVGVLALSWCLGSDRPLDMPGYDGAENVPFWLKVADMFLYAIYILLGLVVALMAGVSLWKRFR